MADDSSTPFFNPSGNPPPDRATIVAGARDALRPDPEAAAAFWRAMPKTAPADALAAALACVAAGLPVYPVRLVRDDRTGRDVKRPAVSDYYTTARRLAEHGTGRTLAHSTLDPETCRAWWGQPCGRFRRAGVGVVLAPGFFALDADDDAAAAWLADVVVDSADTWTIHGGRGARVVYRRPGWIDTARPGGWRHSIRARDGRDVAGGCDVVGGVLVVWWPGRSWTGGPGDIAAPSPVIDAALHVALDPIERPAPVPSAPVLRPDGRRGMRYAGTAIERVRARLADVADGGRQNALWSAGMEAGRVLAKADLPDLVDHAVDQLAAAAPWANTRHERDTIRRGILAGLRQVEPGLPDRPMPARPDASPATGPDVEEVRAMVSARLVTLDDDLAAAGLHWRRRATVRLLAAWLYQRAHDTGRLEVVAGLATIGLAIDRSPATIGAAAADLAALGFEVELGAMTEDGTPRATRWRISARNRTVLPGGAGGGGPLDDRRPSARSTSRENAALAADVAGDTLSRGLRRWPKPEGDDVAPLCPKHGTPMQAGRSGWSCRAVEVDPETSKRRVCRCRSSRSTGDHTAAARAWIQVQPGLVDAAGLADGIRVARCTARRILAALAARGVAIAEAAPVTGRGRPRMLYRLVVDAAAAAVVAVRAVGAAALAKARLAIEVSRARLATARALAERAGGTVRRWLATFTARDRAEREAARPGGDRGRPEFDRERGARALAVAAAWALDGWRQANPTPPADIETPPAWATEAMPIW